MIIDSYTDAGTLVALDLVNRLLIRPEPEPDETVLASVLAADASSVKLLRAADARGFRRLADELRQVFAAMSAGDEDDAAARLNRMLTAHPAYPHLAKEAGRWRMHHHPSDARLVGMWSSICAEALGRLLAAGHAQRVGSCADPGCARVFVDISRNASRQFCSTRCQNRVKTAALRRRRTAGTV